MAEPLRILMICLGNICRSPMAEGALRARVEAAGLQRRVEVDSVGTGGWHAGNPPDPRAIACAARNGVDIGMLRARQLNAADFSHYDHLLCADADNLADVLARAPDAQSRKRVQLLSDFASAANAPVPDPYYGDDSDFDHAWSMVDGMAEAIVGRIADGRAHGRG